MNKICILIITFFISSASGIDTYTVLKDSSMISWTGTKFTGSHNGLIDILSSDITIKDKQILSAEIIIDMKSISCIDIKKKSSRDYFVKHLKSDDFFSVEDFPTSSLKVIKSKFDKKFGTTTLICDLTIKGITHRVEFPVDLTFESNLATAKGTLVIDRTKFGIKYKSKTIFSDIGDKFIYDDFTLEFELVSSLDK